MIISRYYLYKRRDILKNKMVLHCPHRLLWKARQYGLRSSLAIKTNQTKFFFKIGGYTEQWNYLWNLIGFWNKPISSSKLKDGSFKNSIYQTNYSIFIKKKIKLIVSTGTVNNMDIVDDNTYIKYLNKPNGGFNITHFDHNKSRVISLHPGKYGEYVGSGRRKSEALLSWWHFLFSKLVNKVRVDNTNHYNFDRNTIHIRQNLFFKLLTTNNSFLRYFFLLKNYIYMWPTENIYIYIFHNFKKFNLILKKKRYIKKFKRKFMLPSDRINRKSLLVSTSRNITVST